MDMMSFAALLFVLVPVLVVVGLVVAYREHGISTNHRESFHSNYLNGTIPNSSDDTMMNFSDDTMMNSSEDMFLDFTGTNPASGLQMCGGVDSAGNPFGVSN